MKFSVTLMSTQIMKRATESVTMESLVLLYLLHGFWQVAAWTGSNRIKKEKLT